jgi:hypothetical protein
MQLAPRHRRSRPRRLRCRDLHRLVGLRLFAANAWSDISVQLDPGSRGGGEGHAGYEAGTFALPHDDALQEGRLAELTGDRPGEVRAEPARLAGEDDPR